MASTLSDLGRRERQIMDIVIRRGRASAAEVLADLPDPPSYSSVRSMLRLLEDKGYLVHEWDGPRHAYRPTGSPEQLRRSAFFHSPAAVHHEVLAEADPVERWRLDRHAHARVALDVAQLAVVREMAAHDLVAIDSDPHHAHLRAAIRIDGDQVHERVRLE